MLLILGLDAFTKEEIKAELEQALKTTTRFGSKQAVILEASSEKAQLIWKAREELLLAIQNSTPLLFKILLL